MRAVIQRVTGSRINVAGKTIAQSGNGLLVFLGIGKNDEEKDASLLCNKIVNLRLFEGSGGDMDLSLLEMSNVTLTVVSQFTLFGDCRKGRRPSFSNAAPPDRASDLYEFFLDCVKKYPLKLQCGQFRAMMDITFENRGPVTILLDSKREF